MRVWLAVALLVVVVAAGIWDIYVVANNESGNTVSAVLHEWSLKWPILPLIIGLIIGHIFWPVPQNDVIPR